jgi:hypothetical protein
LASDAAFAGQDFVIRNSGQPVLSSIPALVRWVVLRDAQSTGVDRAVLWVKQPDAAAVVP